MVYRRERRVLALIPLFRTRSNVSNTRSITLALWGMTTYNDSLGRLVCGVAQRVGLLLTVEFLAQLAVVRIALGCLLRHALFRCSSSCLSLGC